NPNRYWIGAKHSLIRRPNWNTAFQDRCMNSPGDCQNQNTNHSNILFSSWYEGKAKRYNNYSFALANNLQSAENGGIKNDDDYLDNTLVYKDRFNIPTMLGGGQAFTTNFFSTNIKTGNRYREFTVLMRQQYD